MICVTLVNTQTHTFTLRQLLTNYTMSSANSAKISQNGQDIMTLAVNPTGLLV